MRPSRRCSDMTGRAMSASWRTAWNGRSRSPSGPLIHTTDLPREIAKLPLTDGYNGNGNGNGRPKIIPMAELEKQTILSAIAELNGDKLQAARMLGIGKTTLYRKLKDYAAEAC